MNHIITIDSKGKQMPIRIDLTVDEKGIFAFSTSDWRKYKSGWTEMKQTKIQNVKIENFLIQTKTPKKFVDELEKLCIKYVYPGYKISKEASDWGFDFEFEEKEVEK